MGIFNFFKKENQASPIQATDNGVAGPTYLDGLTEHIVSPKNLLKQEWRRKLKSKSNEIKFKIKFYGVLHPRYNVIMNTEFAPILVYAEAINTKELILIFDGCIHGYNAMFCDKFTDEQINNRPADTYYKGKGKNEVFEIIITTLNGFDYEEELRDEVDNKGFIALINGSNINFETAKRNGFDSFIVNLIDEHGKQFECVSEELA